MPGISLVTGGAGFIGSHLVEWLCRDGVEVLILDDLSTGSPDNLRSLLDGTAGRCRLVEGTVGTVLRDRPDVLDGVDRVYHLAATVGVRVVAERPVPMMRNNFEQTQMLLEAVSGRDARVLIASSSEVYGRNVRMPLREDDDLVMGPTTSRRYCYGLTKALDEHMALAYHEQGALGAVIVRFFNVIGSRQIGQWGMVVPRFVEAAVRSDDLVVYGDGSQTRTFCDVRDVVTALVALMDDSAHAGGVFNLGSDREITIDALADAVIAAAESDSAKRYVPFADAYRPGFEDTLRRVPDLTRIREAIGFRPGYPLDRTLRDLVELARGR